MASFTINETPQSYGDGTKVLHITIENTVPVIYYGFGATLPTTWHTYKNVSNDPMNVNTGFGKIWLKTQEGTATLTITSGI